MNRLARRTHHVFLLVISLLVAVVPVQAQVTFSDPVSYTVGTNPGSFVTVDFNDDGIPDLAVANSGDPSVNDLGSVSVLLGKGDGTFQPALDVPAGAFPAIIVSGDFNGDGKLDLFVEGKPSPSSTVVPWSVLLGHGDGTFEPPLQFVLTNFAGNIIVGDFNNDKKLDLAFIDMVSTSLEEALGSGDGTFQPTQTIATFAPRLLPSLLVTSDFNSDGISDLAMGNGGTVQVLLATANGTFGTPISLTLNGTNIQELLATDVNRDGNVDLIATSTTSNSCELCTRVVEYHLAVHLSNGDGSFQPERDIVTTSTSTNIIGIRQGDAIDAFALGDFDSDGKLDIAYQRSTFTDTVTDKRVTTSLIFIGGQGNGTFPVNLGKVSGSFTGLTTTVDLNGDTLADLGAEHLTSTTIGVILNTTQGFWLAAPSSFDPVPAGGSATGTISVNPRNGFTNPVSLTCSAPQFASIQCSLSSSSVAPGESSTLTVTTTGNSATSYPLECGSHFGWYCALCFPFATIVFGRLRFGSKNDAKGKLSVIAIGGLLLVVIAFQAACGGGNPPPPPHKGTPPGTYTITVTGTAGTISRSTNVSLTVQ